MKIKIFTNIPTPNNLDFFNDLGMNCDLDVVYYCKIESNRKWSLELNSDNYSHKVLNPSFISTFLKKWVLDFHFSFEIFREVNISKADVFIVGGNYWCPNSLITFLIGKFTKKIIYFHSEPINYKYHLFKKYYLKIINCCCKGILPVSKYAQESLIKLGINLPFYLLPYTIDIKPYLKDLRNNDTQKLVFLTSGYLIHRKGFDILISAFKKIPGNHELWIIGDGAEKENLKTLAANHLNIKFLGFKEKNEIPEFYKSADVFVFPSRYDGWGLVINEAIASGLPIIATNTTGAAKELIVNMENGILCKNESVDDFYNAMTLLIENKELLSIFNENIKKSIPHIDSHHNAKKLIEFLSK